MDGTLYYQYPLRICMIFALLRYFLTHLLNIKELWMLFKLRKSHKNGRFIKGNARIDYWMQEKPLKYIPLFQDKKLSMLVDQLRHKGVRIVVYSDYPVAGKLNVLRMPPVDFTFCGFDEEIQCLKPDTKGLTYIMATLNEPAENILFIGDRYEKDGKCAEGVGMDYIILDKYPLLRNIFFYKKELSHVE
ncbi:MAG: HAD-IA family hydrolase [Treponema sp.]|jgi:HAD superfamily hydrolase (TIGR01549 family)|nr:HAD-IA family hydrolase [Treponema sp.]